MTGEIFTIGQTEQRCSTYKKGKVVHVGMGKFMLPFGKRPMNPSSKVIL